MLVTLPEKTEDRPHNPSTKADYNSSHDLYLKIFNKFCIIVNELIVSIFRIALYIKLKISQFKKIEGGKTKVFMLEAAVKKIQGEKQFLKSQLT